MASGSVSPDDATHQPGPAETRRGQASRSSSHSNSNSNNTLWRSRSRNRSRQSSRDSRLRQIYSAGFHDDHGYYLSASDQDLSNNNATNLRTESVRAETASHHEVDEEKEDHPREDVESRHEDERDADVDPSIDTAEKTNLDLEAGRPTTLSRLPTETSMRSVRPGAANTNSNAVGWDGPDDPENPKNWSTNRKWAAVVVVSSFTFISPVASSMVAPALSSMQADLHVESQSLAAMMLSIFILAYAIGPLILGPLSEIYGRVPVLQLSNLFFLIFNLACGFAKTSAQMFVFRFLAGLGGSAPLAIGGGVLGDCFTADQRGKAVAVYSVAPLIGPAIGPVAGGFIAANTTWRWVFWSVTIADAVIQVFGLFLLQETWPAKILARKAARLRKETGNNNLVPVMSNVETSVIRKLSVSLQRPFRMLFTQPIVIALAVYMSYLYGLVYLVITSFPGLYTSPKYYNQPIQIAGLHYIALALGFFLGAQSSARLNDWLYARLKARNGGKGRPEFRILAMIPCAIFLPVGYFWYGWSAQGHVHWAMTDVGALIFSAATIAGYFSIQTYIIDSYTKYAASAVAAISALRSLAGFGFPLFAPAMYDALGYGWGNSVLAFVAIAIGVPAPWLFWHYGPKLRAMSQYAAGS